MTGEGFIERSERPFSGNPRRGSELSASIWADPDTSTMLFDLARRERSGPEAASPDYLVMIPIPGLGELSAGLLAIGTRTNEFRPSVERQDLTVGRLQDSGARYISIDGSGTGRNEVDVDHLGVVQSFTFVDAQRQRRSITGNRLAELLSGRGVLGWSAARGEDGTTQITAPDGRTTYYVDIRGRLVPDRGSVRADYPREVVAVDLGDGVRYDSATTGGEIRSARVDASGRLMIINIRAVPESLILTPEVWNQVLSGQRRDLGHGWNVERGNFGAAFPQDALRIFHRDGTGYIVSPEGILLRVMSPAGANGSETLNLERRLAARTETLSIGPLGDSGIRYITPDRRGNGTNTIDIDHLGVVRAVAFVDAANQRRALSLSLLSEIRSDGRLHSLPGGWRASRTGAGATAGTTLIAPDGVTTYYIDTVGRLISGRGSLNVSAAPDFVSVRLAEGAYRHESLMEDGKVASASVAGNGIVTRINIRGRGGTSTIERSDWEQAANGNGVLANGWWVRRVGDREASAEVPLGSLMLTHADGTTFVIAPNGRYLSGLSSAAWRRLTRRR